MTSDDIKQSITDWCSSVDDLEVAGDRFEPSSEFAMGVKAGSGGIPVELLVLKAEGADRLTLRRKATVSGDRVAEATKLIDARPGSITGTVERAGLDTSVTTQTFIYLDGLSKHTFVQSVSELTRTSRLLDGLAAASTPVASAGIAGGGAVPTPQPAAAYTPAMPSPVVAQPTPIPAGVPFPAAQPVPQPQPMPAPSFTPQPVPQPVQQQPVAQPAPQPAPAGGQWVPSHSVPPQGLRSWAAPDPAGPVVANLAPGLPIQVTEVRGAWARVVCSNGWTGWIDGRIIGVAS